MGLSAVITNPKHKMMISLFYESGLRMNELRYIRLADVESINYRVKVVAGKGGKDRFTLLPKHLPEPLREYYKSTRSTTYFFEGQRKGFPMHEQSIQHFVQQYITKIGLGSKDYLAHTLRHSFATHLPHNILFVTFFRGISATRQNVSSILLLKMIYKSLKKFILLFFHQILLYIFQHLLLWTLWCHICDLVGHR